MKKFTSLFLLFLVCFVHNLGAQTAAATLPTFSQANGAKHYYKIKNVRSQKYAQYKGDATQLGQTASNALTADNLFYFIEVTDASLSGNNKKSKIGAFSTDKFCAETSSFTAQGREWYLIPKTVGNNSGFAISKTAIGNTDGDAWDDQEYETKIGYWHVGETGTMWVFEALTQEDITAIFNTTKAVYKDKAKQITFDLTEKAYTDYIANVEKVGISNLDEIETKKAELENLLTTYTNQLTASFYAKIKNAHHTTQYFSGDGNRLFGVESETSYKTYWKFELAANKKGYTLYNPYFGKYLSGPTTGNPGWTDKNNAGVYYFTRPTPNNDLIFALTSTAISGNNNSIHMNPEVIFWEASAGASKWTITKQTITEQELTQGINTEKGIAEKQAVIDAMTAKANDWQGRIDANCIKAEGTPGFHLVGFNDFNAWNTFLNQVKQSQTTETLQALQEKQNKLNASLVINNVAGKFFRITASNRYKGEVISATPYWSNQAAADENGLTHRGAYYGPLNDSNQVTSLWELEVSSTDNERYYLKHVNSGKYMGQVTREQHTTLPLDKQYAGQFRLQPYNVNIEGQNNPNDWLIHEKTHNQFVMSQGAGVNKHKINGWNDPNDIGGGWTLDEVTSITVKVSAAKYATLNLPFAVEIADKANLKAYIGAVNSSNTNEFVVEAITDGIIPANTPVILHATAEGTYTLNITTTSNDYKAKNKLEGTTIANHKMTSGNYYGLGVLANKTVGFKLANTTDMAANKAYLPKPAGAQAAALSFVFEGQQTGINGVTTEEVESNVYYDLNGRRVLYPTTGLYINAKGQKVFLK